MDKAVADTAVGLKLFDAHDHFPRLLSRPTHSFHWAVCASVLLGGGGGAHFARARRQRANAEQLRRSLSLVRSLFFFRVRTEVVFS